MKNRAFGLFEAVRLYQNYELSYLLFLLHPICWAILKFGICAIGTMGRLLDYVHKCHQGSVRSEKFGIMLPQTYKYLYQEVLSKSELVLSNILQKGLTWHGMTYVWSTHPRLDSCSSPAWSSSVMSNEALTLRVLDIFITHAYLGYCVFF